MSKRVNTVCVIIHRILFLLFLAQLSEILDIQGRYVHFGKKVQGKLFRTSSHFLVNNMDLLLLYQAATSHQMSEGVNTVCVTLDSGADKWPITECNEQIINKDFFGTIFFALCPQQCSVGGTRPDFFIFCHKIENHYFQFNHKI